MTAPLSAHRADLASPASVRSPSLANPFCFAVAFWRHRSLAVRLARRKVEAQYRGSALGLSWAVFQPLFLLGIYTFVFSSVLRARWSVEVEPPAPFALWVFSGMILYGVFSRAANDGSTLLLNHTTFLKQVVFPAEVLTMASVLAALFDLLVGLALWLAFHLLVRGVPPASFLALPVVLIPLVMLALGTSWLLSSLGVFLRDLAQITTLATTAFYFLSPIFYPASHVPKAFADVYAWNPFVPLLESSKELMIIGGTPPWAALGAVALFAWAIAWGGYAWFMRTKHSFADVL